MADRRLQVFHAVAKHLSFTRAAEALFMTQPAVTFQIKHLEAQYRTRLFERKHGSIALTPAGLIVMHYAEKILTLSDELESRLADMTGEMRGSLIVGASATIGEFMLPSVLAEFNAHYPEVRARLVVANSERIEEQVAALAVDVGLIESPRKLPGVDSQACGEDELVVICAPGHPIAHLSRLLPRDLVEYEYISADPGSGTRQATEDYFRDHKLPPDALKIQMELGSPEALKGVVRTGLGFAVISRAVVESDVQLGTLVVRSLEPPLHRTLYVVFPQDRFQTRLTTTFIDFAKRKLRELMP